MSHSIDELVLGSDTDDQFIKQIMSALVMGTKASSAIPTSEGVNEFNYSCTVDKEFKPLAARCAADVYSLIEKLGDYVDPSFSSALNDAVSELDDNDDDNDDSNAALTARNQILFERVLELIDVLLEGADLRLDEASGVQEANASKNAMSKLMFSVDKETRMQFRSLSDIPKPQLLFAQDIDNSRECPFRPRLHSKPFPRTPLSSSLVEEAVDEELRQVLPHGPETRFKHPYKEEIESFSISSSSSSSSASSNNYHWTKGLAKFAADGGVPALTEDDMLPQHGGRSGNSDKNNFEYITTVEGLDALVSSITDEGHTEIAVDLEHHHYRSFQGITCLMQLSTREGDYIIDTLALRLEMHRLLQVFANPNIVKVFHGCESDNLWLQKDLGLYLVNVFDTYHAAKLLKYPACSLAHLLKFFCGVVADKKHQLSDWRQRPLSAEMLQYAQCDTHYLLYIYDCMRHDIHRSMGMAGLASVCEATKVTISQSYEKPLFKSNGYLTIIEDLQMGRRQHDNSNDLNNVQVMVLSALYEWRDRTARKLDESVAFISSNSDLVKLAMRMPVNENGFRMLCGGDSGGSSGARGVGGGHLQSPYLVSDSKGAGGGAVCREVLSVIASVVKDAMSGGSSFGAAGTDTDGPNFRTYADFEMEEEASMGVASAGRKSSGVASGVKSSSKKRSKQRSSLSIGSSNNRRSFGHVAIMNKNRIKRLVDAVVTFIPSIVPAKRLPAKAASVKSFTVMGTSEQPTSTKMKAVAPAASSKAAVDKDIEDAMARVQELIKSKLSFSRATPSSLSATPSSSSGNGQNAGDATALAGDKFDEGVLPAIEPPTEPPSSTSAGSAVPAASVAPSGGDMDASVMPKSLAQKFSLASGNNHSSKQHRADADAASRKKRKVDPNASSNNDEAAEGFAYESVLKQDGNVGQLLGSAMSNQGGSSSSSSSKAGFGKYSKGRGAASNPYFTQKGAASGTSSAAAGDKGAKKGGNPFFSVQKQATPAPRNIDPVVKRDVNRSCVK